MFRFLRIERPTTTTLRPHSTATSAACCMRWMFDANEATRIRPFAQREDRAERLADEPLGAGVPGPLGVRRVAEQEVDAAVADLRERPDVGLQPVDGRVVELPVARVHDPAGSGLDDERRPSPGSSAPPGRARAGTARARAARLPGSASTSSAFCPRPCSSSFDFTSASVSARRDDRRRRRPRAGGTAARRRGPRARASARPRARAALR